MPLTSFCSGVLRYGLQRVGDIRPKFAGVKGLPRNEPDPCHSGDHRRVVRRRRIVLHQLREQIEVRAYVQVVHLVANRRLLVDAGIHVAKRWRVRLAIRAQRNQLVLILKSMDSRVVLRGSRAIGAANDPDHVGLGLVLRHAVGNSPCPSRPADQILLRLGSGSALARHLEDICPPIQHWHQEVTSLHVRNTQDIGFLREIQKCR
jgi:hypothetical protein